jgi:hypothetical protein
MKTLDKTDKMEIMKKYRIALACVALSFIIVSCDVLSYNRGYINEYGLYAPKRPRYRLKDRGGNTALCSRLDTVNVYRRVWGNVYDNPYPQTRLVFTKFYPDGRFLSVSVDADSVQNGFPELNNRIYSKIKSYYYCIGERTVQVESFILDKKYWPVYGSYHKFTDSLSITGDTLYRLGWVFVSEAMPETWKTFPVDW